ncbi:hypothetical protein I8748_19150 [Nostoc sp. CENA67]|uniref:Uncharacterized protein n=1 Tax=Amazonocrinis nigriterrae CENA67 TaxID=2794033 RepID=A0A8J7HXI8_9NOST|nr:hypothetical protein [Amazonocrinis nigriterrae]MBH8564279.1 hypothetical protein [Amazonocrinis nigriterrae CENA67]
MAISALASDGYYYRNNRAKPNLIRQCHWGTYLLKKAGGKPVVDCGKT